MRHCARVRDDGVAVQGCVDDLLESGGRDADRRMERERRRRVDRAQGNFDQDTTGSPLRRRPADASAVPHAFVNYHKAGSQAAYGLGVLRAVRSHVAVGRRLSRAASSPRRRALETFYIQPNIAWQINSKWSVGGGPIFGHSSVELIQALDLSAQTDAGRRPTFGQLGIAAGTEFARATLKGSAIGVRRAGRRLGQDQRLVERRPPRALAARSSTTTTPTRRSRRCRRTSSSAATLPTAVLSRNADRRARRPAVHDRRRARRAEGRRPRSSIPAQVQGGAVVHRLQELAARGGLRVGRLEVLQEAAGRRSPDPAPERHADRELQQLVRHSSRRRVHDSDRRVEASRRVRRRRERRAAGDGDAAAARAGPHLLELRRRHSDRKDVDARRHVLARRRPAARAAASSSALPTQTADQVNSGRLLALGEHLLAHAQGQLLTPTETSACHARISQFAAPLPSSRSGQWCRLQQRRERTRRAVARQSAVPELRRDRQQHHGRLSVGRHQRLDAEAVVRAAARPADGHAVRLSVARRCRGAGRRSTTS